MTETPQTPTHPEAIEAGRRRRRDTGSGAWPGGGAATTWRALIEAGLPTGAEPASAEATEHLAAYHRVASRITEDRALDDPTRCLAYVVSHLIAHAIGETRTLIAWDAETADTDGRIRALETQGDHLQAGLVEIGTNITGLRRQLGEIQRAERRTEAAAVRRDAAADTDPAAETDTARPFATGGEYRRPEDAPKAGEVVYLSPGETFATPAAAAAWENRFEAGLRNAVQAVIGERHRQLAHGYTPEHDDRVAPRFSLADAAAAVILQATAVPGSQKRAWAGQLWRGDRAKIPGSTHPGDVIGKRRAMEIAGAFILAEIERLDRLLGRGEFDPGETETAGDDGEAGS